MSKIKLTKNELKKQKDNLKRFTRYLPTLELKKKQLLLEIRNIQNTIDNLQTQINRENEQVSQWVDVFAEDINLADYVKIKDVQTKQGNIAGIDIPVFHDIVFDEPDYDLYQTPWWAVMGIEVTKNQINRLARLRIAEQQQKIIRDELQITIQRIKMFEEVKIPEAKHVIRVIQIYLGDLQTAEVVRGKIAKKKIEKKKEATEI
jgi:V/A-type H+-transporting ATPase subunit D